MKTCRQCQSANPDSARYCMRCGSELEARREEEERARLAPGGSRMFLFTLAGSILLSLVLVFVFRLPIFILAGFLPLLWTSRGGKR